MQDNEPPLGTVEWVAQQFEQMQQFKLPRDIHAVWRDELFRTMSDAERRAAEKQVQDHPDHPDRMPLMFENRRLSEGPDVWIGELLYKDPTHWRISQTTEHLETFGDMVLDGAAAWQLSPEQIQLLSSGNPPRGFEPESRQGRFEGMLRQFLFGPFLGRAAGEYEVVYARFDDGGSWESQIALVGTGNVIQLSGRMSGETLVVDRRVDSQDGAVVHRAEYAEPTWNDHLRRWVYPEYSRIGEDTELSRKYTLVSLEPLDADLFRRAIQVPRIGSEDAIRGKVAATQTVDYRSGIPVVGEVSGDGDVEYTVPKSKTAPEPPSTAPWRVIGWVAGCVVVVSGVFLWWKRRPNV